MKITYDSVSDALYIYLSRKKTVSKSNELNNDIVADYSGNKLIGIEILNVSKKLSKKELLRVPQSVPAY